MATLLLLLFAGIVATTIYFASAKRAQLASEEITADALAQAKEALIGYAAAANPSGLPNVPISSRPGEFLCPNLTTLADGTPTGSADSPCSTLDTRIGRLPWKTLGLPPLRDGSGEYLWYALSNGFQNNPRSGILNSDTPGNFNIKNRSTGTTSETGVIAVVFAPGGVTGTQIRGSTVAPCSTTGTSIKGNLCPANYLEGENADVANNDFEFDPTIASQLTVATFNDRLLPITRDALFSVVNVRVAKEAITALESYRASNTYYPFANLYGSAAPYSCNPGTNRGRFPISTVTCGQANWPLNTLPAWFSENNWNLVTHYAMSNACGQLGLPFGLDAFVNGTLCGNPTLIGFVNLILGFFGLSFTDDPVSVASVTGGNNIRVLVMVSGRALGAQVHTCNSAAQCLEDAANSDGDSNYVRPSRFPVSNDRMAICSSGFTCPDVP